MERLTWETYPHAPQVHILPVKVKVCARPHTRARAHAQPVPAWTQWELVQHPVTFLKIHLSVASYLKIVLYNSGSGQSSSMMVVLLGDIVHLIVLSCSWPAVSGSILRKNPTQCRLWVGWNRCKTLLLVHYVHNPTFLRSCLSLFFAAVPDSLP